MGHDPGVREWVSVALIDIRYDAKHALAELMWFDLGSKKWITATGFDVVLFKVSNVPQEWEPSFVVDVSIKLMDQSILQSLRRLGYGFVAVESLPMMYHLHAEGDVVIDMVCEQVQWDESVSPPWTNEG